MQTGEQRVVLRAHMWRYSFWHMTRPKKRGSNSTQDSTGTAPPQMRYSGVMPSSVKHCRITRAVASASSRRLTSSSEPSTLQSV
jgi:hypothetical protein